MRWLILLPAIFLISAKPPEIIDPGPQPTFAEGVALAEGATKARLVDPDSAKFEWPYDFTGGSLKALLSRRTTGWITCGLVNSRNRMGGFAGQSYVEVVINHGAIASLDIGTSDEIDLVQMSCQKMVSQGFLKPAPPVGQPNAADYMAKATAGAEAYAARGGMGVSLMPSPVGAILLAVAPGSPADKAGLKPGETIEAVNDIPIAGMGAEAVAAIFRAPAPFYTLKVVGVGDIKITR